LDRAAFGVTGTQVQPAGAAAPLTPEGEAAFGGFHDAGERRDPVRVDVPTGGLAPAAVLLTPPAGAPLAPAHGPGTSHARRSRPRGVCPGRSVWGRTPSSCARGPARPSPPPAAPAPPGGPPPTPARTAATRTPTRRPRSPRSPAGPSR